jgi:prepilin-type N-terminal cleavage/methylation domain-containing protein
MNIAAHRPWRSRAFTLVELLVVIAIIGALLAITIPQFAGIGRGASMQSGLSQLRTTLSLARQWAITKREPTYVVFPSTNSWLYTGQYKSHANKALRAYNVYTASQGYLREWSYLPPGVIIVPTVGDFQTDFGSNSVRNSKLIFSSTFQNTNAVKFMLPFPDTGQVVSVWAIRFETDGRVYRSVQPEIFLSEGQCNVNTNAGTVDAVDFRPPNQRMLFSIDIYGLTGQFRVKDFNKL